MKALAVITAIFLPGEYIGTLFGVDMFNWEQGTSGDPSVSQDADKSLPRPVVMPRLVLETFVFFHDVFHKPPPPAPLLDPYRFAVELE